jgi:hypothetical protein
MSDLDLTSVDEALIVVRTVRAKVFLELLVELSLGSARIAGTNRYHPAVDRALDDRLQISHEPTTHPAELPRVAYVRRLGTEFFDLLLSRVSAWTFHRQTVSDSTNVSRNESGR